MCREHVAYASVCARAGYILYAAHKLDTEADSGSGSSGDVDSD